MNIAVTNNNDKNKFLARLIGDFGEHGAEKVCKVISYFLSNVRRLRRALLETNYPSRNSACKSGRSRTTANLHTCLQIEKLRKFLFLIWNCRQQHEQLNYIIDYWRSCTTYWWQTIFLRLLSFGKSKLLVFRDFRRLNISYNCSLTS